MDPGTASYGLTFLAGLASFLSPCVLPLVPAHLAVLAGVGAAGSRARRRGGVLANAALFVLGFGLLFVAAGTGGGTEAGRWLRASLPLVQRAGGVLLVLLGIYLLATRARPGIGSRAGGALSLGTGVVLAAAWTPCIGPVLATALFYAGRPEVMAQGVALLSAYAAGLGVPFFVVGAGALALSGAAAGRAGATLLRRAAGAVVATVGVLLLTGRLAALTATLSRFAPLIEVG